jgi:hypothetical protein
MMKLFFSASTLLDAEISPGSIVFHPTRITKVMGLVDSVFTGVNLTVITFPCQGFRRSLFSKKKSFITSFLMNHLKSTRLLRFVQSENPD